MSFVTRGLDPRVHPLRKKMDCRVKPGNDAEFGIGSNDRVIFSAAAVFETAP
jgi:hypothetical protein